MSVMVATGRAATQGILFRDAGAIEKMREVDTLIVDKTGTLTEGKPAFDTAVADPGYTPDEVLRLAASLDQGSEHPLADAIVRAARDKGLNLTKADDFESGSGIGVRGTVEGQALALGNTALMQQENVAIDALKADAERLRSEGGSVMHLAVDGRWQASWPSPTRSRGHHGRRHQDAARQWPAHRHGDGRRPDHGPGGGR